jgi:hypothetical protein
MQDAYCGEMRESDSLPQSSRQRPENLPPGGFLPTLADSRHAAPFGVQRGFFVGRREQSCGGNWGSRGRGYARVSQPLDVCGSAANGRPPAGRAARWASARRPPGGRGDERTHLTLLAIKQFATCTSPSAPENRGGADAWTASGRGELPTETRGGVRPGRMKSGIRPQQLWQSPTPPSRVALNASGNALGGGL